jgi:hypothetical protein
LHRRSLIPRTVADDTNRLVTSYFAGGGPSGGLSHVWRNNDDPSYPWSEPTVFGGEVGIVGWVTMIESNFGDPGNLEVICGSGSGQLNYFWRDSGPTFTWNGPYPLVSGS